MKRNIRIMDQTKRGAGGWVVFYSVSDIPYPKGFEPNGQAFYSGRVGMDLPTQQQAKQAKVALNEISDADWTYQNAWSVGFRAALARPLCPVV